MLRSCCACLVGLVCGVGLFAADPKPTADEEKDVKLLVGELSSFKLEDKLRAIKELKKSGPKATSAVPALTGMLQEALQLKANLQEELQLAVVEALVEIGDPAALPVLKTASRKASHEKTREASAAAVAAFAARTAVDDMPTDRRPTFADLVTLATAKGGSGSGVRKAAADKLDVLLGKYAADLLPDLLARADKPDPQAEALVFATCRRLTSEQVHTAALPLVGKSDHLTTLAAGMIAERAKADPKGFVALLDRCLEKPDEKHARVVFEVAVAGDDPAFTHRLRMLGSKVPVARRLAITSCADADNLPAPVQAACRDLLGDTDADTLAAATKIFRLTAEQNKVSVKDCLAMLADPAREKKVLAAEVLAKVGGAAELPAVVDQIGAGVPQVTAAAVAIIGSVRGNGKLPDEATRKRLREWTAHESATLRAATVGYHTRADVAAGVPADEWVKWSKDADPAVRRAAVPGLAVHAAVKNKVATDRLAALAADADEEVKRAVGLAIGGIDPTVQTLDRCLTAETTLVAHVQLKTFFGLEVVKTHLLADLRAAIKESSVLKGFKFDPFADLDGVHLLNDPAGAVAVLRGRFAKEEKLKVMQLEDAGPARAAVCLSDELILTGESKEHLDELVKRKPADAAKTKAVRALIPPAPDPYLGWVAIAPAALTPQSLAWLALFDVRPSEADLKALAGVRVGVRIKDGDWTVELRVQVDGNADAVDAWQVHTQKSLAGLRVLLPLVSVGDDFKPVVKDLDDALDKVKVVSDKTGATATIAVKKETMEGVVKLLAGLVKPSK